MRVLMFLTLLLCFIPPVAAQSDCALPARLTLAGVGEVSVTDGEPLNVRSEPSRSAAVTGSLHEGARFDVLQESRCADGIIWWQIQNRDVSGWIAEGMDEVYFVRPVSAATLETEAQFANAEVFDLANIEADRRLLLRTEDHIRLTDNALQSLFVPPQHDTFPWRFHRDGAFAISRDQSNLHLAFVESSLDTIIPIPSEIDGKTFVNALPSPDGESIAWLYNNCGSIFGCAPDTGYALSITDADGQNRRTIWEGIPIDVGEFRIEGWRSDSQAVILGENGGVPYPEPGSPVYIEPGYAPEPELFEIAVDGTTESNTYTSFSALSDDGIWEVRRDLATMRLYIHSWETDAEYEVRFTGYWQGMQLSFSPQNTTLVWAETKYAEGNEPSGVILKALNLADGTVTDLYDFPSGYAFVQGWLSESIVSIQWTDLQWNTRFFINQKPLAELAFDVTTGEFWKLEFPEGETLVQSY